MTAAQIEFFKNDIAATVADARSKGKDDAEVDHRLQFVWKITLAEWNAAQN
jgi:hypothetical protein